MDSASAKHGFEGVFIICSKVVNQDASLGHIHTTPGAEDFWATRCLADEDIMIGHLKAHVYNLASLSVAKGMQADNASSAKEIELSRRYTPSQASRQPTKDGPEVLEVPDSDVDDWRLQADHLQCIKGGIVALELGGKLTIRSGHFPWKKLHGDFDHQGFVMEGYPEDVLMPGETRSTIRSKGINDLDKREQVILAEALKAGTLVIKHCGNGTTDHKDKSQSHAVIMGEAPPPNSIHSQGRRLLANGVVDREGLPGLRPSTATTKVKKFKPLTGQKPAPTQTPIVIDVTPPSAAVPQKKLVVSVDVPPSRPFKVVRYPKSKVMPVPTNTIAHDDSVKASSGSEEDDSGSDYEEKAESHKRKAKASGGAHYKRRAPSSDIELANSPKGKSRAKGKGRAPGPAHYSDKATTSMQKGAPERSHQPHYRTVMSDSEGEGEKDEVMEEPTHKPLRLRDGPVNLEKISEEVKERPKPKKVLPGSTVAARQVAFYEGGMIDARERGTGASEEPVPRTAYEGPQTGGGSGATSGARELPSRPMQECHIPRSGPGPGPITHIISRLPDPADFSLMSGSDPCLSSVPYPFTLLIPFSVRLEFSSRRPPLVLGSIPIDFSPPPLPLVVLRCFLSSSDIVRISLILHSRMSAGIPMHRTSDSGLVRQPPDIVQQPSEVRGTYSGKGRSARAEAKPFGSDP
ncbi:uncharacterized protein F5147DRAFT_775755 [Suillus discolor]|uniref:Uncharacterized protein n=1 Tax=Suillus discolor TaxID=1912936 RepID=A0A9P7F2H9_9AGAM|nr:uncharacterized protein F5147DRAFT_775755 [Suillus discolor]KAG2104045.1 hypothetical protein F5147DRAFT_775755 [Suillus discolor]